MSSSHRRSRGSSVSTISSFTTSPDDLSMSSGTPEPRGVGLSDPEQSAHRRRILAIIDRMRATGVGSDIDLPMIAVIGSQSAGKSSLIEAISGITLPRAAGTCTRCPTECRLSYSDQPWTCKVVLNITFDKDGKLLASANNITFGPTITDKSEVEERIRRAQRAILNPSVRPETFLTGPDQDPVPGREIGFSKNYVSLELKGPDLTELSFCDLPGLIVSVSGGGNEDDIELVRDLVTSYICKPSCLILLTVTCETDFENQGAHHMAKQHDPNGERTIGVLTKPDRIPDGEEDYWLSFVRDEAEHLANGWFMVKQPSSNDLRQGMTWEEARESEKRFFLTRAPWSRETPYSHRFGTSKLTESLSNILSELIMRRLPELEQELRNMLRETEAQIGKLPPAPSDDAQGEIVMLVSNFARELATYVEGTPDEDGIHQLIRPLNHAYSADIKGTAPEFCPFARGQRIPPALSGEASTREDALWLNEVIDMADKARARELLGHSLFIVTKRLIRLSTEQWAEPSHELLADVNDILVGGVNKAIDDHFLRFRYGHLYHDVKNVVHGVLQKCLESAKGMIDLLLTMEDKAPFTSHEPQLTAEAEAYYNKYRSWRLAQLNFPPRYGDLSDSELLAQDRLAPAILYMADTHAYFQIAYKRFSDMVPMMIDQELLRGLDWDRGLNSALMKGLGITGPGSFEKAKEYLQEPLDVRTKRESLSGKRDRLLAARSELQSIQ